MARQSLARAVAVVREVWEPKSTAKNLRYIREARGRRGDDVPWADRMEHELLKRAGRPVTDDQTAGATGGTDR